MNRKPEEIEKEEDPNQPKSPEGNEGAGGEGKDTVAQENERLRKENEEHKRKITELSSEKTTIEKRLEEMSTPAPAAPKAGEDEDKTLEQEIAAALEEAQIDPAKAAQKMTAAMRKANSDSQKKAVNSALQTVNENTEWEKHVATVRDSNKDLEKHEKRISRDAAHLIATRQETDPKKALEKAISNFRDEFGIKKPEANAPENKAPKGSQGESGGGTETPRKKAENDPSNFPEADGESDQDYVAQRKKILAQKGA